MSLTLYFLRHGQTALSREDVFCGSGSDPELTEDGLAMAESFAAAYRAKPWRALYSSTLRRAVATARPLATAVGLEIEEQDGLKEIGYGRWERLSKEAVEGQFHDDYISWLADPAWHAPTEGETAVLIARRGLRVVEDIRRRFDDGNVLVVSHKATIRIILCALLGVDVGRFRYRLVCPVGSVSAVEFTAQGPLLHVLSDRSHLDERQRSLPGT
jgi:broad specificity phosphatase PhoE